LGSFSGLSILLVERRGGAPRPLGPRAVGWDGEGRMPGCCQPASMPSQLRFPHGPGCTQWSAGVESTGIRGLAENEKGRGSICGLARLLGLERWVSSKCGFARSTKGGRSSPLQDTLTHLCQFR